MSKETNTYKIFTTKMAQKLCQQGYKMIGTEPNRQKPWLYVYLFKDTKELRQAVQQLKGKVSANE